MNLNMHISSSFFVQSQRSSWQHDYARFFSASQRTDGIGFSINHCKLVKQAIVLFEGIPNEKDKETALVLGKVKDRLMPLLNYV